MIKNCFHLFFLSLLISACSSVRNSPKYEIGDGRYEFRQDDEEFRQAQIYFDADSLTVYLEDNPTQPVFPIPKKDEYLRKQSLDVDVTTILFKYRPAISGLPRQLTTDFNGNLYVGYRVDRFRIINKQTPRGNKHIQKHRAITLGGFGGLGASSITPWTTNNKTTDEYSGLRLQTLF